LSKISIETLPALDTKINKKRTAIYRAILNRKCRLRCNRPKTNIKISASCKLKTR